jgi:glycosyltransferase involved in cell wall biosynthesis
MSILAQQNRVMYVEPRTYLRQTMTLLKAGQLQHLGSGGPRVTEARPNLYVYHNLPYAPISGRFPLRHLTSALRLHSLRHELNRRRFGRPILWLCRPEMGDLIGLFDERLLVYHVVDEYSAYEGVSDPNTIRRRERAILERADVVLTTAPALLESKSRHSSHVHLVPNAVNYEAFAAIMESNEAAPADLAALPRPVAGYVGAINAKLDLSLILALADARQDWTVALVGPVDIPASDGLLEALRRRGNVHFLGTKPVAQVPAYIKGMDVCLLPYQKNEWTRNISSLKLYEYFACGQPVVSSDVPAAREYANLVAIASDATQFIEQVGRAWLNDSEEAAASRRRVASSNTWLHRVEQISRLIESALLEKNESTRG